MGRLQDLYAEQGQSPWLDNLKRGWITSGGIQEWIDRGVRGITSNPSIFQKAIAGGEEYTEQLADLTVSGASVADTYWDMVTDDITAALGLLRPLYDSSDAGDGYVSVEVDPTLAHDGDGTLSAARALWEASDTDTATGGPDVLRGIYPIIASIDANGWNRVSDESLAATYEAIMREVRSR